MPVETRVEHHNTLVLAVPECLRAGSKEDFVAKLVSALSGHTITAVQFVPGYYVRVTFAEFESRQAVFRDGLHIDHVPVPLIEAEQSVRFVYLHHCPVEVPDSVVFAAFCEFGSVLDVSPVLYCDSDILTGSRVIKMSLQQPIPSKFRVLRFPCRVWYRGQPVSCFICDQSDHVAALCFLRGLCRKCRQPAILLAIVLPPLLMPVFLLMMLILPPRFPLTIPLLLPLLMMFLLLILLPPHLLMTLILILLLLLLLMLFLLLLLLSVMLMTFLLLILMLSRCLPLLTPSLAVETRRCSSPLVLSLCLLAVPVLLALRLIFLMNFPPRSVRASSPVPVADEVAATEDTLNFSYLTRRIIDDTATFEMYRECFYVDCPSRVTKMSLFPPGRDPLPSDLLLDPGVPPSTFPGSVSASVPAEKSDA